MTNMNALKTVQGVLGWAALISYGVLMLWWLLFVLAHDWLHRVTGAWLRFELPVQFFDAFHFAAMGGFKIGFILLFLVPWIALLIVRRRNA